MDYHQVTMSEEWMYDEDGGHSTIEIVEEMGHDPLDAQLVDVHWVDPCSCELFN